MFNSPLSVEKADRLIDVAGISGTDRVLDAGCGTGEFLIRVMERTGAWGLGVDKDAEALARRQRDVR